MEESGLKECDSEKDVEDRIKDCVDFAFKSVLSKDNIMRLAMWKNKGGCNPKVVWEEIEKRLKEI